MVKGSGLCHVSVSPNDEGGVASVTVRPCEEGGVSVFGILGNIKEVWPMCL